MAKGDFTLYAAGPFGNIGTQRYQVSSGTAASINAGEPVYTLLGQRNVAKAVSNQPRVASDYIVGIAQSTSTETVAGTYNGVVDVWPAVPGQIWLCAPTVAATWNTQDAYDILVGDMVIYVSTAGVFTITSGHSLDNGLIVRPLDIVKYPGKVAVEFRQTVLANH